MKLVFAIVNDEDSPHLMSAINQAGFSVTKLNSTGGFLRSGNTTLMMVVEDEKQQALIDIIKQYSCSRKVAVNANMTPTGMGGSFIPYPVEVKVGGATVFSVNVEHFEKI